MNNCLTGRAYGRNKKRQSKFRRWLPQTELPQSSFIFFFSQSQIQSSSWKFRVSKAMEAWGLQAPEPSPAPGSIARQESIIEETVS